MAGNQPTIYDISEKTGFSIATVSRVINNSPKVTEATREKVLKAIEEAGFKPNVFARGLGLNTMKTVGIMCVDSSDIFLARAVYLIEEKLRSNQYDTILCCTGYDINNMASSMDLLISKKVDAVILVGSTFVGSTPESINYIINASKSVPVMILNAVVEHENIYCFHSNDSESIYRATVDFIKGGSKNIAYLYNSESFSAVRKLQGFTRAIEENNSSIDKGQSFYIRSSRSDIDGCSDEISKILSDNPKFDAIVTSEDLLAMIAVKQARSLKRIVPEKLQIIGYNNSILAQLSDPALSSIDNRVDDLCDSIVDTLMDIFAGSKKPGIFSLSGLMVRRLTTRK